ncbi:MAG: uroporphyrinogen decarboxylase [Spirochaetaceae bacterium]|nr:uroporphyrinogen decarboxylase [Spirochaetaceae bacterium]
MLTIRQNLMETIRGGNPDRFVNQYEFIPLLMGMHPIARKFPAAQPGGEVVNGWGVTYRWGKDQPGAFPVHDDAHKVLKDITKWKNVVKAPSLDFPASEWESSIKTAEAVNRNEVFACPMIAPGVFEQLHYLQGIDTALANMFEEPGYTHEIVDYIVEYELRLAEGICTYIKPDAIFHHDDWGTQTSSFFSPEMFEEYFVPAYKKIYGYYRSHGVELIIHHSDSYAANLVPQMIDIGIDIFQGCITTNDVPGLVKKFGEKISFMGDLNNGVMDKADWTPELIRTEVERACRANGKHYFIPCLTRGGPGTIYPGVYEETSREIDRMSKVLFG